MAMTHEKRLEIEALIYKTMDAVDKTHSNSEYYKTLFAKMDDNKFFTFLKRRLPFRFHTQLFKVEPSMSDVFDGFRVLKKPLLEKVNLNYLYKNKDGKAIQSKECLVLYINIKRMKQMRIKKTNTAFSIDNRDMKTGRLLSDDKGGIHSDKEFEANAAIGLENVIIENSRIRADAMKAKIEAYNNINIKGEVSFNDIDVDKTDSLAKNYMNTYLMGCGIMTNMINTDYYTPYTLSEKKSSLREN